MQTNRINILGLACAALAFFTAGTSMADDNTGTGGTITYTDSNGLNPVASPPYIGGYVVHTFTSSDTLNIPVPASADVLVVAGGGGGGCVGISGGGGGAGGVSYSNGVAVAFGDTTVTVGAGGLGGKVGTGARNATSGSNSVFGGITAFGGGNGASYNQNAGTGSGVVGSGGGGAYPNGVSGGARGTGTPGQGKDGGAGQTAAQYGQGGGGGAGSDGQGGSGSYGGYGGTGLYFTAFSSWGDTNHLGYFGGGGGGSYRSYPTATAGGAGGWGGGGQGGDAVGLAGQPNTGGGGGGADYNNGGSVTAGDGGSGIVIVRYPYALLGAPPTLVSIVDNKSGGPISNNTLVTYTVTFNKDMDASTVDATDFGNAGSATISFGTVTETTPGVFTVQVTPTTGGSLILKVNAGAVLNDADGIPLVTTSALPDDTTITVDATAPTLAGSGIVDDKSGGPVQPYTLVTYTVTFDEAMDPATVSAASFGNAGTAAVSIGTVTETTLTSGVFTVPVTPTTIGTLILEVNQDAVMKDVVGNALDTTSAIPDDTTITVNDTIPPTLVSIVDNKSGGPIIAPNTLVTYTVTFSEAMDAGTVDASDFGNAGGAAVTIGTVSQISPAVFSVQATPTSGGSLRLQVNQNAGLTDLAANPLDTTSAILDDTTITVDATPPTLTSIVDNKSGGTVLTNALVTYTVTFSEDMDASTVSASDFGTAGTAAVTIGTVTETTSTSGVFTVPVTATGDGTLQLKVNVGAVLNDAMGNALDTTSAILDDTTITVIVPPGNTGTGGTITFTDASGLNPVDFPPYAGGYVVHTFTNSDTLNIPLAASADVLVVAGGGGGGGSFYDGGGGGAGGLIYSNGYTVVGGSNYTVTVGAGGAARAGNSTAAGNDGSNSWFGSLIATGGGGGGNYSAGSVGRAGGSGGGGAGNAGAGTGGTGISGQGRAGGNGYNGAPNYGAAGGGGAGTNGANGTATAGGNGGDGLYIAAFSSWGDTNNPGWFAGGGGGSTYQSGTLGLGGKGGGGANTDTVGKDGQPNTGGGGGAAISHTANASGSGGSGIVIVRYPYADSGSPYSTWANGANFTDPNSEGIAYGMAWMLGAGTSTSPSVGLLPAVVPGSGLTLHFKRVHDQGPAKLYFQYSSDLATWPDPELLIPDNTYGTDLPLATGITATITEGDPDDVTVTVVPAGHEDDGKLFGRLKATEN